MQFCDYLPKLATLHLDLDPKRVFAIPSRLRNGKASAMSMIPNKILKSAKHIISESLTDIFNASLEFNTFPDDLKVAGVTPIFKIGKETTYRTIDQFQLYVLLHGSF